MNIAELIKNALEQEPYGFGAEKALYTLEGQPYLVAIPRKASAYVGALSLPEEFPVRDQLITQTKQDFLPVSSLLESTALANPAQSEIFFQGVAPGSYGGPILTFGEGMIEGTPLLAIHPKIEGVSFQDYLDAEQNPLEEILGWEQSVYDDFLLQVKLAGEAGHRLDFGPKNRYAGNIMISFEPDKPKEPKLTLIDLQYNQPEQVPKKNNLYPIIELLYYQGDGNLKSNQESWEAVFEKLVQASRNVGLGLDFDGLDFVRVCELPVFLWLAKAKDELEGVPSITANPKPEPATPKELRVLTAFPRIGIDQDAADLFKLLRDVAKADLGRKLD